MSRANTAILDGVEVGYGTRDSHNIEDAVVHTMGRLAQAEVRIDASTIASLATGVAPTSKSFELPTGAAIHSSKFIVEEVFADLTSIIIGTKGADGVTEDDNGLHTVEVLAVLLAGATFEGNGAQVGGVITDEPLYVSLDVTGTAPTTGSGVLVIEYYQPVPTSEAPAPVQGVIGSL